MAGMPERAAVFFDGSPIFSAARGLHRRRAGEVSDPGLAPALRAICSERSSCRARPRRSTCDLGSGHVVLIGFRPQWRGQPFGTFRVLFNAALYHGAVAAAAKGTPGFWSRTRPALDERADDAPSPTRRGRGAHDRSRRLRSRRHARRLAPGSRARRQRAGASSSAARRSRKQAVVRMVGEGAAVLVRRALRRPAWSPDTPGALDRFLAIYDTVPAGSDEAVPGTIETLEQLARPMRLAVLTNKPARATRAHSRRARPSRASSTRSSAATRRSAASPTPPACVTSSTARAHPRRRR